MASLSILTASPSGSKAYRSTSCVSDTDRVRKIATIGYDPPQGWPAGGMLAWRTAAMPIDVLPQWTLWQLQQALPQSHPPLVLDVRQPGEWQEGHIPQALRITGAEITRRADEIPPYRPIAVICGSGYRSSVAASVLKRRGHSELYNVLGGMTGWQAERPPMVSRGEWLVHLDYAPWIARHNTAGVRAPPADRLPANPATRLRNPSLA